jgi:hypothetical protein
MPVACGVIYAPERSRLPGNMLNALLGERAERLPQPPTRPKLTTDAPNVIARQRRSDWRVPDSESTGFRAGAFCSRFLISQATRVWVCLHGAANSAGDR